MCLHPLTSIIRPSPSCCRQPNTPVSSPSRRRAHCTKTLDCGEDAKARAFGSACRVAWPVLGGISITGSLKRRPLSSHLEAGGDLVPEEPSLIFFFLSLLDRLNNKCYPWPPFHNITVQATVASPEMLYLFKIRPPLLGRSKCKQPPFFQPIGLCPDRNRVDDTGNGKGSEGNGRKGRRKKKKAGDLWVYSQETKTEPPRTIICRFPAGVAEFLFRTRCWQLSREARNETPRLEKHQ